ncbi:MAG: hypothetical protein AAGE65_04300, partial [Planctomycetota bacterium]
FERVVVEVGFGGDERQVGPVDAAGQEERLVVITAEEVVMFSGWVQFRFRETRALTMPGFFSDRYSPGVRKSAGVLAFVSGVMNYGIFPAVTANLIVAFCGLP